MTQAYETVIGLEVHVELSTETKIFCGCSTAFGGSPNSHTCPVCAGMPGALPVLNRKVLQHAIAAGLAMNCEIAPKSLFDRKNYFYPDNPQNYQISQRHIPICQNGYVEIETENGKKRIGICEIHMEEDAGKLIHEEGNGNTLIDYNRSGIPLIEIVTEPDMSCAKEVIAFLEKVRMLLQYLRVSDCKLQEGSMRADVNLSVRKTGSDSLGIRTEMKNLGSFSAIKSAIDSEKKRQIALIECGERIVQETRRWDEARGESYSMRSKEDGKDYRYFPDPDLPPVWVDEDMLEQIRRNQPEFQPEKKRRYQKAFDIPDYDIDIITSSRSLADLFEETVALGSDAKKVSNWIMGETLRLMKDRWVDPENLKITAKSLASLIRLASSGEITQAVAKEVFEIMFDQGIDPQQYVKEHKLETVQDEEKLRKVVECVLLSNPKSVEDYRSGKEKAIGFLVGQTMKEVKGKADPGQVKHLLRELL